MTAETRLAAAPSRTQTRCAAAAGFCMLVSGSFSSFVLSHLVVSDDLAATAGNIAAAEFLFRLGIVGSLLMALAWKCYAIFLYRLWLLFQGVDAGRWQAAAS